MENIWETAKTNEKISLKFKILMGEYLHNGDYEGVGEAVRELRCEYYMHELVRRALIVFIEHVSPIHYPTSMTNVPNLS